MLARRVREKGSSLLRQPRYRPDTSDLSLMPRFLLCLATAGIIALTAHLCAWLSFGDWIYFKDSQVLTRSYLKFLHEDIVHYQEKTGSPPADLKDLDLVKQGKVPLDEFGRPLDGWKHPFHYEVGGSDYDFYSLGRDGRPGG